MEEEVKTMTLFGRRRSPRSSTGVTGPNGPSPFQFDVTGPEKIAEEGKLLYGTQQFAEAASRYEKAIDLLHTLYVFENMRQRQPSPADAWIVDGYVNSLGATLALDSSADVVDTVRTVTHRLRSITTAAERVGLPTTLYRAALDQMHFDARHVNVDDIRWD
jgi:hypothetical protein